MLQLHKNMQICLLGLQEHKIEKFKSHPWATFQLSRSDQCKALLQISCSEHIIEKTFLLSPDRRRLRNIYYTFPAKDLFIAVYLGTFTYFWWSSRYATKLSTLLRTSNWLKSIFVVQWCWNLIYLKQLLVEIAPPVSEMCKVSPTLGAER